MSSGSKKLRIALVTNNYTPYSGGVVSSINAQVTALQEAGHVVKVITLDFLGKKQRDPDYVVRIPSSIRFMYKKNYCAVPWRKVTETGRAVESMNADIVHVHHPFFLGVAGHKVARRLGLPLFFTYHTMYEHYAHYVPFLGRMAKPFIQKMVRSFCQSVDGIIVPSKEINRQLQTYLKAQVATVLLPSPLQKHFMRLPFLMSGRSVDDPFQLITVSRFVREKDIPFILDVFSQLDDRFFLTIIGYGPEYKRLRWYAYTYRNYSPQRVRFVIQPPQDMLINYYSKADLFLFASQTDTQGLVLIEAMACSTPIVARIGPGQKDSVINDENGFLINSKMDMIEKIFYLANNPMVCDMIRKRAWHHSQSYSIQNYRGQLINFYRKFIGKK